MQKQRAEKSQDAVEQMNVQLMERDAHIAELRAQGEDMRALLDKVTKEKAQVIGDNNAVKMLAPLLF